MSYARRLTLPIIFAVLCVSCHGKSFIPNPFAGGSKSLTDTAGDIRGKATETTTTADAWESVAPSPEHHARVVSLQADVKDLAGKLDGQAKGIKEAEAQCEKLRADLDKERSKAGRWESAFWFALIAFGALGLVAAPVVAYFGSALLAGAVGIAGATAIGVGMVGRTLSGFFNQWGWLIGLGVALLVLFGLGIVAYTIYRKAKKDNFEVDRLADIWRHATDSLDAKGEAALAALRRTWPELDVAMTNHGAAHTDGDGAKDRPGGGA